MKLLVLPILLMLTGCMSEGFSVKNGNITDTFEFPEQFLFGQPGFGSSTINNGGPNEFTLNQPEAIWFDGTRVYLCDRDNRRVLIWNSFRTMLAGPSAINVAPDVILQQPNATTITSGSTQNKMGSCRGILTMGNKLLVSDPGNNRVLIWSSIPTVSNTAPDMVLGQSDFTSSAVGTTASGMSHPMGLGTDGTKLFVADRNNNRILIWDTFPTTPGEAADAVLGQSDFISGTCNRGGAVAGNTLCVPTDVKVHNGKLYVVDRNNNRVLVWNTVPASPATLATYALGQPDLASSAGNNPSLSGITFSSPWTILVDDSGVYVSDYGNSRMLKFDLPISSHAQAPTLVIGQSSFTTRTVGNAEGEANGIIATIKIGDHFIFSDQDNHRLISDILQNTAP